jgi:hypothetical protein
MGLFSSIAKGVGVGLLTDSWAGGLTAMGTDSFWAGMGVGTLDNMTGKSLSYGMGNCWGGNYGWGGFYGGGYGMDYSMLNSYNTPYMNYGMYW